MESQPPKLDKQLRLPGMRQVYCKCGCGRYFISSNVGRPREYLNDTHKKREARRQEKLRRTETTVKLVPKGWMYLHYCDPDSYDAYWERFSSAEKAVIQLICDTGFTPEQLQQAMTSLFDIPF